MRFGQTLLAAAATIAFAGAPVAAQAAATKPVPAKVQRAGTATTAESKLGGGSGVIVALVAAAAVVLGIVLLSDDDKPTSP